MKRSLTSPQVLLLVETSDAYGRGILQGIGRYVRERGPWSIFFEERSLLEPLPRSFDRWQGDGIISRTATRATERRLRAKGVPVVELLGLEAETPAKVHGDGNRAGRLAAEHLLGCGLRYLAFFSFGNAWWIGAYQEGFVQRLAEQGLSCDLWCAAQGQRGLLPRWNSRLRPAVAAWLHRLPKPLGIFCPSTGEGRCLLDLCRSEGLAVPERVAVLAGADDPAICEVTTPSLSGIDFDSARIGYEAAALLDRLMSGRKAPQEVVWIPPIRVVARHSTDVLAVADPDVARAMRFIRERACRGIRVPDVVRDVGLSRRTLERRFQQHLGRTPKEEILRMRIDRATFLFGQSEMSIEAVARSSGFASFKHFARLFRRETGVTPGTFRRTSRSAGPSL